MSINAINNISFASKNKDSKKVEYKRTDAFKIMGASAGGILGLAGGIITGHTRECKGGGKIGFSLLGILGGAVIGALSGVLADFTINKTVKNVVISLKTPNNQD